MQTGYRICPLCGRGVVVNGRCVACGYVVGSDADIDSHPTPIGGYPDEILIERRRQRKSKLWSLACLIGWVLLIVGVILIVNKIESPVCAIGIAILIVCFVRLCLKVWKRDARAWANRQRYWAYGERPDWKKREN